MIILADRMEHPEIRVFAVQVQPIIPDCIRGMKGFAGKVLLRLGIKKEVTFGKPQLLLFGVYTT